MAFTLRAGGAKDHTQKNMRRITKKLLELDDHEISMFIKLTPEAHRDNPKFKAYNIINSNENNYLNMRLALFLIALKNCYTLTSDESRSKNLEQYTNGCYLLNFEQFTSKFLDKVGNKKFDVSNIAPSAGSDRTYSNHSIYELIGSSRRMREFIVTTISPIIIDENILKPSVNKAYKSLSRRNDNRIEMLEQMCETVMPLVTDKVVLNNAQLQEDYVDSIISTPENELEVLSFSFDGDKWRDDIKVNITDKFIDNLWVTKNSNPHYDSSESGNNIYVPHSTLAQFTKLSPEDFSLVGEWIAHSVIQLNERIAVIDFLSFISSRNVNISFMKVFALLSELVDDSSGHSLTIEMWNLLRRLEHLYNNFNHEMPLEWQWELTSK